MKCDIQTFKEILAGAWPRSTKRRDSFVRASLTGQRLTNQTFAIKRKRCFGRNRQHETRIHRFNPFRARSRIPSGGHWVGNYAAPMAGAPLNDLDSRVVIITGGTRGIGLGVARHLGALGAKVVITGRKPDRLSDTVALLESEDINCVGFVADVADRSRSFEVVNETLARFGRIDGLVLNAQSFRPVTPLLDVTESDMNLLFDTGPKGALWLMQAAQPHMAANNWGRIVTMGTSMGLTGAAGYGPYAASNEAIRSLTRTAAREWGRDGITVNCVLPASAGHRAPVAGSDPAREAAFASMYDENPVGRDGDAVDDIGPAVAFLLSDGSRYVTGQTISVDGGGIMRP
jgi:NAD(P)-dependent dehydrogenase (short-subunit alcohol dehydrogenase family)